MHRTLPRLRARTIFFDIDDTITTGTGTGTGPGETAVSTLVRVVASVNRLDSRAAREKIESVFDPERESMDGRFAALGITERAYWDALMDWMPSAVAALPDAVSAVKALHASGYRLYPATTNGRIICRAKLAIAGLADFDGSRYFHGLFGGAEIHPAGKSCGGFFSNLLARTSSSPETTVHVGDLPEVDLRFAREAGIGQVVLPRRGQPMDWVMEEGGLYVNSLELLPGMLMLPDRCG